MASFRKHKNGTWEYRLKYKDPFTQKYKEKSKRGFKTKKEAQLAASEMERKLLEGIELTNDVSLKHFLHEWLYEYKKPVIRKNTFQIHKHNIEKHIVPYFKEVQLRDIKPIMYQKFLNYLAKEKGYSKRTVEIIHGTMNEAYNKAVTLGKVEKNPCNGATIPTKKTRKKEGLEFLATEDIPEFLKTAYEYDYIYWIFFKVLIETGMRKGEAAALQWSDIDLKEGTIRIDKSLDFTAKDDEKLFGDTKTYNSKRTITISNSLINDLQYHIKWQNQNKLTLNDMYKHHLNLVLCRKDGDIMPKSTLFNVFRRILKKANLPQLPIHSLRHTHAVLLLEAGADLKYIQERLGHGSIQITSDVYSHISKKIEQNNMKKYEELIKGIF
ncbi:site-specific integrase [Fervidibacillus albus]|uniref:Site-specific integrase n=1 Tax=Fervidibacillus albus TaxID=2980026 RepID=A0A9E8LW60_9BACI|nr:site-specific integrase [Fervidibacillus albus]WAA10808.1 site-specific integrase [Fervidibacillus albus]